MAQKNKPMTHGKVQLLDVPCFLANYRDGHDAEFVRIGFVIGEEVRFLDDKVLSSPAQSWLREDIMCALGLKDPEEVEKPKNPLEQQV